MGSACGGPSALPFFAELAQGNGDSRPPQRPARARRRSSRTHALRTFPRSATRRSLRRAGFDAEAATCWPPRPFRTNAGAPGAIQIAADALERQRHGLEGCVVRRTRTTSRRTEAPAQLSDREVHRGAAALALVDVMNRIPRPLAAAAVTSPTGLAGDFAKDAHGPPHHQEVRQSLASAARSQSDATTTGSSGSYSRKNKPLPATAGSPARRDARAAAPWGLADRPAVGSTIPPLRAHG